MFFFCNCLNVQVHTKGKFEQKVENETIGIVGENAKDLFFQSDVAEVILDIGGITKQQPLLCKSRQVGKWKVWMCSCCGKDTHALQGKEGEERVLVNLNLEEGSSQVASLIKSENYSRLFKIILPSRSLHLDKKTSAEEYHVKYNHLEPAMIVVQQQVSRFLRQEQQAMQERIRKYTEQQQIEFASLQARAHEDKQVMLYMLADLQEKQVTDSLADAMIDSPLSPPLTPMTEEQDTEFDEFSSGDGMAGQGESRDEFPQATIKVSQALHQGKLVYSLPKPMHGRNVNRFRKKHMQPSRMAKSVDTNTMFDIDGVDMEEDTAPFYTTDDEGDTDDSSVYDEASALFTNNKFATSLPISMPVWSVANHSSGSDEEEKFPAPDDPEQMVASIKALAMSVHDGTEMFGDLPKRRLNTGELVKSRPI
ncbi:uncharacterized protein LOC143226316 [Tachypleus tridentatus]|uniref:uncharacterized protein LOC143226316 n=1 Tax=Tachypleus tridentatus TaxID=6853 RepID=UPI003FD4AA2D